MQDDLACVVTLGKDTDQLLAFKHEQRADVVLRHDGECVKHRVSGGDDCQGAGATGKELLERFHWFRLLIRGGMECSVYAARLGMPSAEKQKGSRSCLFLKQSRISAGRRRIRILL